MPNIKKKKKEKRAILEYDRPHLTNTDAGVSSL